MDILSNHCYQDDAVTIAMRETHGNYLEIGTFNGVGAANIAKLYANKTIYVVDPFIEDGHTTGASGVGHGSHMSTQKQNALNNFKDLSNVVLYEQTNNQFASTLTDEIVDQMNVGWVLIDGSHHFNDVVTDYNIAIRLIGNKSGVSVFDDLRVFDVANAYNQFQTEFGFRVHDFVWIGDGSGILVKIKSHE